MTLLAGKIHPQRTFVFFSVLWLIINLIQAYYTELSNDEAYYWMYSQHLDFGYFDHPPMVAWMIYLGTALFDNELGVRLISVIFSFCSVLLLQKINKEQKPISLILMFASLLVFQLYSFTSTPDAPLFFFTVLLFYQYQKFLKEATVKRSLVLGLVVALLLYSKYHGILVVFFLILSNLRILKNARFYIVFTTAAVCYLPHILWQVDNNYPSYTFHVLSKSHDPYSINNSLVYLLGQWIIFGPLIAWWLFKNSLTFKTTDLFEKGLKYVGIGFIIFFLFSTINSPGELNWTAAAVIPFLILTHRKIHDKVKPILKWLCLISIFCFVLIRVFITIDPLPFEYSKKSEFHKGRKWANQIKKVAGDRPVVFINSYQNASKYAFYSRGVAHSMNNSRYRRNQYDLWPMEEDIEGQEVMIIPNWNESTYEKLETDRGQITYTYRENYRGFSKIQFDIPEKELILASGESKDLILEVENSYKLDQGFKNRSAKLHYEILKDGVFQTTHKVLFLDDVEFPVGSSQLKTSIEAPKEPGKYYLKWVIIADGYPPFINSRFIPLEVE